MTAQELHALVEPIREAMVKDGVWPMQDGQPLVYRPDGWWAWERLCSLYTRNAYAEIVVSLLGWALAVKKVSGIYFVEETGEYHVSNITGPTILHALVAAYRAERNIK